MSNNEEREPRSVVMSRTTGEASNSDINARTYQVKAGNPASNIPHIKTQFNGMFDLIILHDAVDGCLVINLMKGAEREVEQLPCRTHMTK